MGEKRFDVLRSEGLRMPLAVEEDEAFNPIDLRLLRANAVVPEADLVADAIEETWRRVGLDEFGAGRH